MPATTQPPTPPLTKDDLKERHPGWNIIHSAQGGWWAQQFPVSRELAGEHNMLNADSPEALDEKLTALEASR
ncbi:hypothetical protein SAMN05443665_101759 [Actinomadura meyerae]|uniref:Uncharacterized protein n=1 Tax=Actinomadura meyerae TaxID=240840 RepID=A0A239KA71_9ACTN|nr:hypothetical protein [Actinomadura meyerae]SNT14529.1 hypothetical protein SAMN05443665_101759 [Actinomadura meyerae]